MPIATQLAVAALAAAAPLASTPLPHAALPIIVSVSVTARVSSRLVDTMLEETDAIWRAAGFNFVWRRAGSAGSPVPSRLSVIIADERGSSSDGGLPLGWIRFDGPDLPGREIYVSRLNARVLLDQYISLAAARRVVMPLQEDLLMGRAMGRALAHELGHYLLRSKAHSRRGLMQGTRSSFEMFATERVRFEIDADQRQHIAAALAALLPDASN